MFSVICSVKSPLKFKTILLPSLNRVRKHLIDSNLPELQIITVGGSEALTINYNEGMARSKYKTKFFIHEDVDIMDTDITPLFIKIDRLLHDEYSKTMLVGLAGTTGATNSFWWDAPKETLVGQVYAGGTINEHWIWNTTNEIYSDITYIDGMFMATSLNINFSEDIKGFHLYDNDYCNLVKYKGYKIQVINHLVRHDAVVKDLDLEKIDFNHYRDKWGMND